MTAIGGLGGQASGTQRFSDRLRVLTGADHEVAASSGFVGALLGGRLPRDGYAALVAQHYFVYTALEGAGDGLRDDPIAGPFVFDELTRGPALAADLRFLLGPDWAAQVGPNAATAQYCTRIRAAADEWPGGFVAHHYTRYLGDLSGGQIIAGAVSRAYGLEREEGVQFYRFDQIADLDAFKDRYRALLDAVPWTLDDQERAIAEMRLAYHHNTEVLAELDRSFPT